MKKVFALVLCFVMLFTFAGCGGAKEGDVVKVPVEITKNPGMVAAQFIVEYDAAKLTFLGYNNGTIFEECETHDANGKINVVMVKDFSVSMADVTKTGTLLTLKFQIKNGAPKGKIQFSLGDSQFINTAEKEVEPTIKIADIKVK